MSSFLPHSHLAFGKRVESDIELPLLPVAADDSKGRVAARVEVSSEPLSPAGPAIGGNDNTTVTIYRDGENNLLALNGTGWLGVMSEGSSVISLHPDARHRNRDSSREALSTRIVADRVVTSLLPYLPVTWNRLGIHASLLDSPFGPVLIQGDSGFGKSTISQILQQQYGWIVLDDDTSMLGDGDSAQLTPLGAQSRLRSDAAATLGIAGVELPGFGGHKSALIRTHHPEAWDKEYTVKAVVQLGPTGSRFGGSPDELFFRPLSPQYAIGAVFAGLFSLSPDRPASVQRQFRAAARWSTIPHFCLGYDKAVHNSVETVMFLVSQTDRTWL